MHTSVGSYIPWIKDLDPRVALYRFILLASLEVFMLLDMCVDGITLLALVQYLCVHWPARLNVCYDDIILLYQL